MCVFWRKSRGKSEISGEGPAEVQVSPSYTKMPSGSLLEYSTVPSLAKQKKGLA